jgi:excisionase family DNA binding protein
VEQRRTLALEEIERLLAAVRDDYKPFILVAMFTGARFGELRELRWKDIDFTRGTLRIQRQRPTHDAAHVRAPKWGGVRTIEMLDPVRRVLEGLCRRDPDSLVFPARGGGPIHPSYFRRHVWNPALARSGVRLRLHEMRDVFVSLLIGFGEDIMRITRQTGHRHLAVFFNHYAHEFRRAGGSLSREETYSRLIAAMQSPADPGCADYIGVNQAAKALGVSWGWLFELIRRGKLPAVKRGKWLIPKEALAGLQLPRSRSL